MGNFLNSFINWLNQNNEVTPLAISDYFVDEGKLFDVAEKIYNGNKSLSKKYGFSEIGDEEDYQRVFAAEDFAPLFCYYNEFYNAGEFNPKFNSNILLNYRKSAVVKKTVSSVTPEKWRMLALKVSQIYIDTYDVGSDALGDMLYGYCHHLQNGEYVEDWES